jgi:flagellar FliL protein
MSKDKDSEAPAAAGAAPPRKSKKLLFIIAGVLLVAGAGGGYWWFGRTVDPNAPPPVEEPKAPPAIISLDPFVVNLADEGEERYLRVTMGLVVYGEEHAKEFSEDQVARLKVRSSILEMLAQQTAEHLITNEGKAELKKAIAERASHNAEHLEVSDVLFSEFIVQ